MKRRILVVALGLALTLLSACGGEGKINAPFESSYYRGKNVNEIVDLLENAGFTNIELQAEETSSAWNEDAVISIQIGSNMMFNTANAWEADIPIVIEYYEFTGKEPPATPEPKPLEVFLDISVSGEEGLPVYTIHTNLPDDTIIGLEMDGTEFDGLSYYTEQQNVVIKNGTAVSEPFSEEGNPLKGQYDFYVMMLPTEQPSSVLEIIGEMGENMTGSFVTGGDEYHYISTSLEYKSQLEPEQVNTVSLDEVMQMIDMSLALGFGSNYTVTRDGNIITANVWQDGIAIGAVLAANGSAEHIALWNIMAESVQETAKIVQSDILEANGHGGTVFVMNIVNDANQENILLSIMAGVVVYDSVNDIDTLGMAS